MHRCRSRPVKAPARARRSAVDDRRHRKRLDARVAGQTRRTRSIDSRVRTVCALAPASEAFVGRSAYGPGELPLPEDVATLVIAGIDDVLVDLDESVRPLVARLGPNTAAVGLADADHFHFCDGIELLHAQHESNPRPGQPRATKTYAESLPAHRAQRAIRALTTSFCEASFSSRTTLSTGPTPDGLATLDAAVRWL